MSFLIGSPKAQSANGGFVNREKEDISELFLKHFISNIGFKKIPRMLEED
jgi:hypothetical protein